MDHFLLPRGATVPLSEKAPYIADEYDNGSFLDYPHRSRFKHIYDLFIVDGDEAHYDKAQLQRIDRNELNCFLQTWLFFGLLYEIFGDRATSSSFTVYNDEAACTLLTTINLPSIAQEWIAEHVNNDAEKRAELLDHLLPCLQKSSDMLKQVRRQLGIDDDMIMCSIAAVGETLESIVLETLEQGTKSIPTIFASFYEIGDVADIMRENNWCPSEVAAWRGSHDNYMQMKYYVSKMKQPEVSGYPYSELW